MASYSIPTQESFFTIESNNDYTLGPLDKVTTDGAGETGIRGRDTENAIVRIEGEVEAQRASGVELTGTNTINGEITLIQGALVMARFDGVTVAAAPGSSSLILNQGAVQAGEDAFGGDGLQMLSGGGGASPQATGTLRNEGTVTATDAGMYITGHNTQVTNTGMITAEDFGIHLRGGTEGSVITNSATGRIDGGATGIRLESKGSTVRNNGELIAEVAISSAVYGAVDVVNTGTITATHIAIITGIQADDESLDNRGTITGDVSLRGGDDFLKNAGTINGLVDLGLNDDFVNNRGGTINGDIDLGGQNDILRNYGGVVTGVIMMGNGDDTVLNDQVDAVISDDGGTDLVVTRTNVILQDGIERVLVRGRDDTDVTGANTDERIIGNNAANTFTGADGDDFLNGQGGSDSLDGGDGDDTILAGAGRDTVNGGEGDDSLVGRNGSDLIDGGNGDDSIKGEIGNDTIIGSEGKDRHGGGDGNDTFVYTQTSHADRDVITDFETGDTIDLSAIGEGEFVFLGTSGFSASGQMEVRLRVLDSGSSVLRIDENGDGVTDAQITMTNVTSMTADDFIL